jgi:hypothetical protein
MTFMTTAWRRGMGLPKSPLPHHWELLTGARQLSTTGHHASATIVAFTACEVQTEQILSWMLAMRRIAFLAEPLDSLFASYNLTNQRLRRLYNAVSLERIEQAAFWKEFSGLLGGSHCLGSRATQGCR